MDTDKPDAKLDAGLKGNLPAHRGRVNGGKDWFVSRYEPAHVRIRFQVRRPASTRHSLAHAGTRWHTLAQRGTGWHGTFMVPADAVRSSPTLSRDRDSIRFLAEAHRS